MQLTLYNVLKVLCVAACGFLIGYVFYKNRHPTDRL